MDEFRSAGSRLPSGADDAMPRQAQDLLRRFPGAGKTNAMLTAAQRMRESGRDVVAGVVDTHESADRLLLDGFETLPPPVVDGLPAPGELDLDGALARHPEVILIDDLAHANPAGSRHPKRWKDADELLAEGIDVFTTMGVQHLESLNDVVGEICGIREPETVPDTFFDTADETVMVDMSADELLVRLGEGKVHVRDVEKGVAGTFFSKGSLLALREIALRRTADVVEYEVQKLSPSTKAIDAGVEDARAHLLCCIGPGAGSEHVVRSAARLAKQLDAGWTAVYVETPRLQRLPVAERGRILNVVRLAEELGAKTAILTGNDVCEAIVDYSGEHNIARVVVGRSRQQRFTFKRSMSDQIASSSDSLDVMEIGRGGTDGGTPVATPSFRVAVPSPRRIEKRIRYVWTALACLFTTLVLSAMSPELRARHHRHALHAHRGAARGEVGARAGDRRGGPQRRRVRLLLRAAALLVHGGRHPVLPHLRRDARGGTITGSSRAACASRRASPRIARSARARSTSSRATWRSCAPPRR